jgi:hypothetical protein
LIFSQFASSQKEEKDLQTKANFPIMKDEFSAPNKNICSDSTQIHEKSIIDVTCCTSNKDNNKVPPVPLNSHDMVCSKEEYWLPSYIEDELYIQMCEKEVADPQGKCCEKISKYYLEAAKYARRISAGDFDQIGTNHLTFLLDSKDFTPRLTAELAELYKRDKESLDRVIKEAIFRIFKARHKMFFYQYIEGSRFRWRFI